MKPDPDCEDCGGTGVVYEDEYENGQIVGRGTLDIPCICTKRDDDEDLYDPDEYDR